jgi:hypothetical protein
MGTYEGYNVEIELDNLLSKFNKELYEIVKRMKETEV